MIDVHGPRNRPSSEDWQRPDSQSGWSGKTNRGLLLHLGAWLAVIVFSLLIVLMSRVPMPDSQSQELQSLPVNQEMTGRLLIGAKNILGDDWGSMLLMQADALRTGSFEDQLAYALLRAELVDPETGMEELERINALPREELPRSAAAEELAETVGILLFASASGERTDVLPEEQRAQLERSLGIYGSYLHARAMQNTSELAQLDAKTSQGAIVAVVIVGWFLLSLLSGIVVLVVLALMLFMRMLPLRISSESAPSRSIYIETFAIWLFLHIVLVALAGLLVPKSLGTDGMLLAAMIATFASLVALFWPRIRGVPFDRLRQECGLYGGNVVVELLAGLATYTAALPILLIGIALSAVLGYIMTFFVGEVPPPEHPIQEWISGSIGGIILTYLVACVAAPIVEEIMFRGVLYRYLRDGTRRLGWILSFAFSAIFSSFIFAAIHPQGITFIPVLGALAVGFCIGREWRGSLVAPMTAHAINNGVVVTLNIALLA